MRSMLHPVMCAAVLAGAFFTVGASADMPQTPKATAQEKPADYFPHKKGTSWTYASKMDGKTQSTYTETVTKEETGKDGINVTISPPDNLGGLTDSVYRITSHGVLCVKSLKYGPFDLDFAPLPLIQYPLVPGKKWEWSGKMNKYGKFAPIKADFEVIGSSEVKTPAGMFKAIKVHSLISATDPDLNSDSPVKELDMPMDYWIVPGIGIVRRESQYSIPGLGFRTETVLVRYKAK